MSRMSLAPILRPILRKTSSVILSLIIGLSGLAAAAPLMSGSALALSGSNLYVASSGTDAGDCQTQSSPCQTIAYAIGQSNTGDTISLESNISITSAVNINKALTLEGNGFTLSPTFTKSDSSNNASIMVLSSDVTIQNLTIDGSAGTSLHGINVYEASDVNLNNVRILNNDHAALIVNGSTVAATDLNTSGNAWGAVDVDPGSGVNAPSVFTLYSGSLSESNQIWSDGSHVSGSATVTVNASGYNMYKVGGTSAWYFWTNQPLENFATITKNGATTAYTTIQAAVDDSVSGDIINVAPGTYNETVTIDHKLTIEGAQAGVAAADTSTGAPRTGSESTVSRFYITAGDVTLDGFTLSGTSASGQVQVFSASTLTGITVENNIFSGYDNVALPTNAAGDIIVQNNLFTDPSASAEAIQIKDNGNSGDCSGTKVLNNVFNAATTNGAADINLSCTGSGSTNVTVSGNRSMNASDPNGPNMVAFSGVVGGIVVSNNTANTSGSNVFFFGSVTGSAVITGNNFSSGGRAVSIYGGDFTSDTQNSGTFTISNNSFNNIGIKVAADAMSGSGSVDASPNYWGSATPNFSSLNSGNNVTTTPYFTNSAMTTRSDAKVLPDSSGDATANNTTPQVVVSSSSQPLNITVTSGTTNASVDYSALVGGNTGTLPQTTITAPAATVTIPAATTVTATGGTWNGTIAAPATTTVSLGSDKKVATAIEVGDGNLHLTFSNAVRLLLPGQAGESVGFIRNGDFTQISNACSADNQATVDTQLAADGDCYISVGADMVIWTKHFTTFVAYSPVARPASSGSGSSAQSSSTTGSRSSNPTTSGDTGSSSEVLGASSTPTATPSTSSATTTQPSSAEAFQPPSGGNNKFLGIAWYIWLIGIAGVALASYIAYAYLSVDRK